MITLQVSDEVKNALKENKGVVALESTIISHGMPYPQNKETALLVEKMVRDQGAVPATIAIINGVIKVGLTEEEIDYLGKMGPENVIKTSRRDIPIIVSKGLNGATTVSATMIIAQMANIKVFATGGIGGVHRGAESTMDISADLEELAMTNVCVVCAGIKSILDLGLTKEYLETKGVPIIGYQTKMLPAFYTNISEYEVDYSLDTPKEIANMLHTKWSLGLQGGVVCANPIPKEYAMEKEVIDHAILEALEKMEQLNIKGKESTPFLLSEVKNITKGDSLKSNIQLVLNNAMLAANIAKELVE